MSVEEPHLNDSPTDKTPEVDYSAAPQLVTFLQEYQAKYGEGNFAPFMVIVQDQPDSVKLISIGTDRQMAHMLATVGQNDDFLQVMAWAVQQHTARKVAAMMEAKLRELGALDADGKPTANAAELLAADAKKTADAVMEQMKKTTAPKDEPEVAAKKAEG